MPFKNTVDKLAGPDIPEPIKEVEKKQLSRQHSSQVAYFVEVKDNMPESRPITLNGGVTFILKDWVRLRPEWMHQDCGCGLLMQSEDSPWTNYKESGLVPYATAMAMGWSFLGAFRLRQVEFRVVKCEIIKDIVVNKEKEFDPIKLPMYGDA